MPMYESPFTVLGILKDKKNYATLNMSSHCSCSSFLRNLGQSHMKATGRGAVTYAVSVRVLLRSSDMRDPGSDNKLSKDMSIPPHANAVRL